MKSKFMFVTIMMLILVVFCASNVCAAEAPYGMDYVDGTELGENNVTVNPDLIRNLKVLVDGSMEGSGIEFDDSWEDGYIEAYEGECQKVKYYGVYKSVLKEELLASSGTRSNSPHSFYVRNDKYIEMVNINNVDFDYFDFEDKKVAIMVEPNGAIGTRRQVYMNDTCTEPDPEIGNYPISKGGKVFVETNIKVLDATTFQPVESSELYFAMTDIDVAQSYKILNSDNVLSKDNMFVDDVSSLQPTGTSLRNMFNADEGYIYSEYNGTTSFDIREPNAVYVQVGPGAQEEGLYVVFGFAQYAGSGAKFYVRQYKVSYDSDVYGEIIGKDAEDVMAGESPTGSAQRPNQRYLFRYWIANQDVMLSSGETIPEGEIITDEQIKMVVIDKDIKFTAIHVTEDGADPTEETEVVVPNTGAFTGKSNGVLIAGLLVPVVGFVIVMIKMCACKKNKVKFEKK